MHLPAGLLRNCVALTRIRKVAVVDGGYFAHKACRQTAMADLLQFYKNSTSQCALGMKLLQDMETVSDWECQRVSISLAV